MIKRILSTILLLGLMAVSCAKEKRVEKTSSEIMGLKIKKQTIDEKIYSMGTISYIMKTAITSKVTGEVERVTVDVGSVVERGAVLIQIDKFPLELELKKAVSDVDSAESSRQLSEAKYNEALKRVEQQLKVVEKAEADVKDKKLAWENSQKIFERKQKLFEAGGVTQEEVDNMKTELNGYETRYELALKEKEIQMNGYSDKDILSAGFQVPDNFEQRLELLKKINTAVEKADIDVQSARFRNAQANVESIKLLINKSTITSPISGIVAAKNIEPGERVVNEEPLLVVMNIDEVYGVLNVPSTLIGQIRKNEKVELISDAIPDMTFKGTVNLISPVVDMKTRVVEVRARVPNPAYLLKPGMFVRANIFTGRRRDSIIVPSSTLVTTQSNSGCVFILTDKKEVFLRSIRYQEYFDNQIEVTDGLKENEIILLNGSLQLSEGDLVNDIKISD